MAFKPKQTTKKTKSKTEEPIEEVEEEVQDEEVEEEVEEEKPVAKKPMAKKETPRFAMVQVATETAPTIQDQKTGETYDILSSLIYIMNKLEEFE